MKAKSRIRILLASYLLLFSTIAICQPESPPRPLIFVPGILGSNLVDEQGKKLWGGRDSYRNFHKLGLPRDPDEIQLRPSGVVETIKIVWPFKLKQYAGLLETLENLGYERDVNLFIFAYDWRRSNFTTAKLLAEFIDNTPALKSSDFDIIAHSMGGLVSFVLIHEHSASSRLNKLITLGTPYFGSLNAFDIFLNGFSGVSGFMSRIGTTEDQVLSVMFSFESGYELLPSYDKCCVLGKHDDQNRVVTKIYDYSFWQGSWLPGSFSSVEDKEFVKNSLIKGQQLRQLVDKNLPQKPKLYIYAGDKYETKTQVYVMKTGDIEAYRVKGGDGSVFVLSATRGKEDESRVSFKKHAKIFEDKHLIAELKRILTPTGELQNFAASANEVRLFSNDDEPVPVTVDLVSFEVIPPIVFVGETAKIRLELSGTTIVDSDKKFDLSVCSDMQSIEGGDTCIALTEQETQERKRVYEGEFETVAPGSYSIQLDQIEEIEDYFAVVTDGDTP